MTSDADVNSPGVASKANRGIGNKVFRLANTQRNARESSQEVSSSELDKHEAGSSDSDFFDKVKEIQNSRAKAQRTLEFKMLKIPSQILQGIRDESADKAQTAKEGQKAKVFDLQQEDEQEEQALERQQMFEFDMREEMKELVKRYTSRINLIYSMEEID
mmetsp:Transcript_16326/g.27604  ORF Transcript_16326/g.27604 Transcript_16326/m.27604 type:complete len:160 (+) Transcript_16326:1730-2209(+)